MKKLMIAMAAVSAVGLTQVANAYTEGGGGTITFHGVVKKDTCYANPGSTSNIDVDLGTVQASSLKNLAGATGSSFATGSQPITIECGLGDKVKMSFVPGAEADATGQVLRVNGGATGAGLASGVGIVVLNENRSAVLNLRSDSIEKSFPSTATAGAKQTATITLNAAYIYTTANADAVTPGTANANLPFVLSYE